MGVSLGIRTLAVIGLLSPAMAYYGRIDNPTPVLSAISPNKFAAGSPTQVLTVSGQNFVSSSTIQFNGAQRPTKYVNSNRLTIVLSSADLAVPGTYTLVVTSPPPGGGNSTIGRILILARTE